MDLLIGSVGEVDVLLLRIFREGDVPNRAVAESVLVENFLFDERAVGLEDLDAIVDAVAYVEESVIGEIGAMDGIAELLGNRLIGRVRAEVDVVRLVAVGTPIAFEFSAIGVEDDNALVAVSVGDVDFIGLLVDENLGGQSEIFSIVTAVALSGGTDLHQKLAVL